MDLIREISRYIIDSYGLNTILVLETDKDLAIAIEQAYLSLSTGGPSLITNTSAFESGYYQDNTPDLAKLQEKIKTEILTQMYNKNLLTESEYKKACHIQ